MLFSLWPFLPPPGAWRISTVWTDVWIWARQQRFLKYRALCDLDLSLHQQCGRPCVVKETMLFPNSTRNLSIVFFFLLFFFFKDITGQLCYREAREHGEETVEDTVHSQFWNVCIFVFLVSTYPFVCELPAVTKARVSKIRWARKGVTASASRPLSGSNEGPRGESSSFTVTATVPFSAGERHTSFYH